MVSWIILLALFALIFVFIKAKHVQHRFFLIIMVVFLAFFYLTVSGIIKDTNANPTSFDGITKIGKVYLSWFVHIGGNLKTLTGNAIKMDWRGNVTGNSTKNSTK